VATQFSTADNRPWKRPYFTLWGGQAISQLGSRLVGFALVWYLTVQTGSASVLAGATLVTMLPELLLGPVIGALVDRWNRRRIMLLGDGLVALATLLLALLFAMDAVEVWHIYAIMMVRSLGGGFQGNATAASASLMVPREELGRIQGLNQMLQGILSVVAAPLGALLYETMPLQGILAIDIFTALFAILPLFWIAIPQPEHKAAANGEKPGLWTELLAGVRYVRGFTGLLIILVMASLINFTLNPASSLLPLLVQGHFGKGALELGYVEAAFGIGIIAGGLLLSLWGGFKKKILTILLGLIGLGAAFALMGVFPASGYWWMVGAAVFAALMLPFVNGSLFAVMQSTVAPEMQGRVFTLVGTISMAMSPLGLAIAGPLADSLGIQTWYWLGGLVCAGLGMLGFTIPAVMNLEEDSARAGAALGAPPVELSPLE
jgi:DHA3 family macrolide efflux protein-like MFS transporter